MITRAIAVLGAGVGGLGFAAMAAARGANVTVFDQFAAPKPIGSGLVIQPVGQRVLRAAGGEAAMELGQRIDRMVGHEVTRGQAVLDVSYDPVKGPRFGLAIHRASLLHALLEAARNAGAVLVADHKATGRDGQYVCFEGDAREGPFDLIVDASGANSPLSPLRGRALPFGALWATVPWPETDLPEAQLSQAYRKANRMAGVLPIGRLPDDPTPLTAVFWSLPREDLAAWRAAPLDEWKAEVVALWPEMAPFLATLTGHEDLTYAAYSHGTLMRPVADGLAIIGDAAHRASPQLGQGANMALLDAHALVHALGQHHHLPDALRVYVMARRWHIRAYQAMSAIFTPQYQSDSRVAPMLRDWVLAPFTRVPPMPRVLSRMVCGDLVPPYGSLRMTD